MTKVEIKRNKDDWNIKVKGHANYGPHGSDIVCASISTICCLIGRILNEDKSVKINIAKMEDGDVEFDFNTYNTIACFISIRSIIKGFKMIAEAYPENCSYSLISV